MKKWAGLVLSICALAGLAASPANAVDFPFSGSIDGTEPTQTGRLFRDEPPSTCAVPQSAAITGGAAQYNYDAFTVTQGSTASCVTVTVTQSNCTGATPYIHAAAYLGSFNPANPLTNYLADIGNSPDPGPKSFSFDLAANQTLVIVINEVGTDVTCSYTGTISGLSAGATPATFRSVTAARTSKGVMVHWSTASEFQMLGFNVYREVNGRRTRVNSRLIVGKGRGLYAFLDRKAPRVKLVRYWIQAVNLDGSRTWYGPARVLRG